MSEPLTRRDFARSATAGIASRAANRRPNLLFVFSDQQSSDMLGCYGNRQIVTPRLDRFAAQGVRFNHCIANSPLCTPYRGLLFSGQHTLWNGAFENDVRMLPGNGKYFGEILRDAGYRMGYVGKWHLYGGNRARPIPPGPYRYGFDHTFLSNNCTVVFDKDRAYYWDEDGHKSLYGDWEPYAQAHQAMRFIDDNAGKPFALFVSWHPPHNWAGTAPRKGPEDGYGAPADVLRLYDPDAVQLRGNCVDTPSARKLYQGYMAMISSVDRAFGWLMDKLEEKSLADNTIVIFTSDHGDTALSHGLLSNKMRPEIESIRVPLLVRYPQVLKPRASDLPVGTLDLMPTLLSLMGLTPPETCHGKDLASAIVQQRDNEVESVPLFLFALDWRGVYTPRYTYAFDTSAGRWCRYRKHMFSRPAGLAWKCLYDRDTDRWELRNLYDSPDHKRLRARLHEQTLAWMKRFSDQGLPYDQIQQALFSPDDLEIVRDASRMRMTSGMLRGRPIDMLNF
jgi:arylsulfatase A-like enzyme